MTVVMEEREVRFWERRHWRVISAGVQQTCLTAVSAIPMVTSRRKELTDFENTGKQIRQKQGRGRDQLIASEPPHKIKISKCSAISDLNVTEAAES